jgi:hypothetical protein
MTAANSTEVNNNSSNNGLTLSELGVALDIFGAGMLVSGFNSFVSINGIRSTVATYEMIDGISHGGLKALGAIVIGTGLCIYDNLSTGWELS